MLSRVAALADDPPAVANLLVHGGSPSGDVFAATLVDLAARGHIDLELRSGGAHFYRPAPSGAGGDGTDALRPFEKLVLELMREQVADGAVPASAVTLGFEDDADDWWQRLRSAVVAEGRARRYTSRRKVVLGLAGVGLLALVTLALMVYGSIHDGSAVASLVAVGAFVAFMLVGYGADGVDSWIGLSRSGRQRARRWAEVRHELRGVGGFGSVPAGGVTVWGAHLAYAVALGVAPEASADLPLGPDQGSQVWVRRGTGWRQVRVGAPWWLPPGWGRSPRTTVVTGLLLTVAAVGALVGAAVGGRTAGWGIVAGVAAVGLVVGGWQLALGIADLAGPDVTVEGPVVAIRASQPPVGPWRDWFAVRYTVVVDDGTAAVLPALRVEEGDVERIRRGDRVRVVHTRRLRHVRFLDLC